MKNNSVMQILSDEQLWQSDISEMYDIVSECYAKTEELGAKGAMEWILSE